MKSNRITSLLFSSFLLFTSCEKDCPSQEVHPPRYPSEGNLMDCTVDGDYWSACGIFLSVQALEIAYHYDPLDSEFGKLVLKGNRFDACDSDIDYDYGSSFLFRLHEGTITNEKKTIDLKDPLLVERILFAHWGNDPDNNFENYSLFYDKIIDGQITIDSLLLPNEEKELHGKVWCSFWVDLSLSEEDLGQGEPQDTIHIRDGHFDLTSWWD
jgi:hypothetical protein